VVAIRDLGMPTSVLDLALAVVSESPKLRPIYIAGYEAGYQDSFYPGLYDPETAADVTPLLNAFEAAHARDVGGVGIDASSIRIPSHKEIVDMLRRLDPTLRPQAQPAYLREMLNSVSMCLLESTLDSVAATLLERLVRLTSPWRAQMSKTDLAIDDCLRRRVQAHLPLFD
jgi:hypothetical protein